MYTHVNKVVPVYRAQHQDTWKGEVKLHSFFTSALEGHELSPS